MAASSSSTPPAGPVTDVEVCDRFHAGETHVDSLGALAGPEAPEGNVVIESAVLELLGAH